ncbi:helix-turn-helix domain-containing protein [Cryptosporangium phraense]|uniref:Helix-turn-helix domain-containing protein n=1 Tax=Cryptosporangium phraense TaxID=2593070 RepID=A0A545AVU5_9ACTN|nr:helix-turn-helix domain-containing protein [Cryptosporangium phraense]
MHAALGEPVRLALVDRLSLGDASPGELAREAALATNLLAHHLRVLEDAGVIRRRRSDGDRRRSYVQLVDDPLVAVVATAAPIDEEVGRVVFVCTQNTARSQLAAAVWARRSPIPVASAGTHPADRVHPRAVRTAHRHDLDLDTAGTRHLSQVTRPGDLLVAVCDNAYEELTVRPADPPAGERIRLHWSVPDPAAHDSDDAFEDAYQQISGRVDRLAHALSA